MNRRGVIKGPPLNLPVGLEAEYAGALVRLVNQMTAQVERDVVKLFSALEETGQDATPSAQARALADALSAKFQGLFDRRSKPLARKMVDRAAAESNSRVASSLRELSKGITLGRSMVPPDLSKTVTAAVSENVDLIRSISEKYLERIKGEVMRSVTTGEGVKTIQTFLEKEAGMTKRRAQNIALDQTRKVYNNVNAERMKSAGIKKFEWVHSSGGLKPREHHLRQWPAGLNGGVFSFDALPIIDENTGETGIPGQAINCRCRMVPVLEFEGDQ